MPAHEAAVACPGAVRKAGRARARDREPETRKTASGSYPGRPSNSAPDEGDGTRTARGFPPAWHLRAGRRSKQREGEHAIAARRVRAADCRESEGRDRETQAIRLMPPPVRPETDLPPTTSRQSTAKRESACVSVEMFWRERITEQSPRPSTGAASNAGGGDELLRVDAPDRSGIQLVARVSRSRNILNR